MVKIIQNERVLKLREKSKSSNTQKKYEGDWLKFIEYCKKQYNCHPVDVDDLNSAYALTSNYLDWLHQDSDALKYKGKTNKKNTTNLNNNPYSKSPYKASTIQRILASISYKYRLSGYQFDRRNPEIFETISAIVRNDKNKNNGQAREILKEDLVKIINNISNEKDNLQGIRDKALILLGFYSFCRRSEIILMNFEDLSFSKSSIEINIRYSKTDQTGLGRVISIPKTGDLCCPVTALNKWLEISNIKSGRLFYKINKSKKIEKTTLNKKDFSKVSLTDSHFVLILKKRAKNAGITNCEMISGHSLRIGAITQARINGVPVHEIMAQSGHKTTQMIDRYTKLSNIKETSAAKKI
ncbi:MAG: hypothetical protein CFH19_00743 [Alphaproteobacteria bacterium MarineAlpha5_Bin9]|nr:MAG: hypothetical protein CFH19_00743 [Alphaproteobacteria bacterium MarineAlpha5_Bin9]|tara:strand:- start:4730 stop:5791 length:1062 start_codon:yes stop_codon:yes gene_type:complete